MCSSVREQNQLQINVLAMRIYGYLCIYHNYIYPSVREQNQLQTQNMWTFSGVDGCLYLGVNNE